jgi:hypothetical protein
MEGTLNKDRKAQLVEQVLFVCLVGFLGGAGFLYEWFKGTAPQWQVVAGVIAYMGASYLMYRLALSLFLRKL